jgi:hypothetical protein
VIGMARITHKRSNQYYDPVPSHIFPAFNNVRNDPEYDALLRRVRDWMLSDDPWFRLEAPRLLKAIAGGLSPTLYHALMEWVETNERQRLAAVVGILHSFNSGPSFYALCREIIRRTDDDDILGSIRAAIGTTPEVISGPMSRFTQQRLEEVSPWLQDDDLRVRIFAQRVARSLQTEIEREQAQEEYEERNWPRTDD